MLAELDENSPAAAELVRAGEPLIAAVQPYLGALRHGLSEVAANRLVARIAWSAICEPGDRAAGALVSAFGPEIVYWLLDSKEAEVMGCIAGSAVAADHDWSAALDRWRARLNSERIVAACRNTAQLGVRVIVPEDAAWPSGLDALADSKPHVLWVRGQLAALRNDQRNIALVGARAASQYGLDATADLTASLSDRGFAIISGGAYGIDAAAHRTALASDAPTVAVLAGGVDRLYPASHRGLFEQIIRRGAIVSELIVGQAPERWRFIQRNRIIAALAAVTVVVEAGHRSGALHTARSALEIGRPVGAVPGPISAATSVGCHRLIRDQLAQLVSSADDIVEMWHESLGSGWCHPELDFAAAAEDEPADDRDARLARMHSASARRVHDALRVRNAKLPEELAEHCGMSLAEVRGALTELELSGLAATDGAGWRRV